LFIHWDRVTDPRCFWRYGFRRLLDRHVPGDLAIVGQYGIAMSGWKCHDLTTLALDNVALIDAIERHETGDGAAPTTVIKCTARWGSTT
jgi:hypothetical protein